MAPVNAEHPFAELLELDVGLGDSLQNGCIFRRLRMVGTA